MLLSAIKIWPESALRRLSDAWVTEAEQVLSMAAGGVRHLAEQTGLSENRVADLIEQTRRALPPEVASHFAQRIEPDTLPTGALRPLDTN